MGVCDDVGKGKRKKRKEKKKREGEKVGMEKREKKK